MDTVELPWPLVSGHEQRKGAVGTTSARHPDGQ